MTESNIHEALTSLDYFVIVTYVVGIVGFGFWISLRQGESTDFFLAGRSLGWKSIGLSIFGTNVAPSMLIASCGIAYSQGMVASTFEWLAWPFLMLLAVVFLPHYLATRVSTMPQFLLHRYGDRSRQFLSYYAIFTTCISLSTTLFAGGILMSQILGWSLVGCMVAMMVIATSFTIVGGLQAVTITDAFQSLLMIGVSLSLTLVGLYQVGGPGELIAKVDPSMWQLFRPSSDDAYPWHAVLLGYPVMAIWFFCTNQLIVQRALGAQNLDQAEKGVGFAAYLKILTPLLFAFPGVICSVLYPGLEDSDAAYTTMVTGLMPSGMVGMVVAVLIAALISTINSQLNSLSTLVTVDVYCRGREVEPTQRKQKLVGQIVMAIGAVIAVVLGLALSRVEGMDLFSMLQSIIAFMAPSMAVVFLAGVLWRRASPAGALVVLVGGNVVSIGIGICYLAKWPVGVEWPHFLLLSFYLFCALAIVMVVVSLATRPVPAERRMATVRESWDRCQQMNPGGRRNWTMWAVLAAIMTLLYVAFEWAARG